MLSVMFSHAQLLLRFWLKIFMGGTTPLLILRFFWTSSPHIKTDAPYGAHPPLKNEAPRIWKTVINTCVSIIKQHWEKMAEIPQEHGFLTWGIQTFVGKVKQFVRKHYITCLMTQFVLIDIGVILWSSAVS